MALRVRTFKVLIVKSSIKQDKSCFLWFIPNDYQEQKIMWYNIREFGGKEMKKVLEVIRKIVGSLVIIGGLVSGLYAGIGICIIGGISQIIHSLSPFSILGITIGILRVALSSLTVYILYPMYLFGSAIYNNNRLF